MDMEKEKEYQLTQEEKEFVKKNGGGGSEEYYRQLRQEEEEKIAEMWNVDDIAELVEVAIYQYTGSNRNFPKAELIREAIEAEHPQRESDLYSSLRQRRNKQERKAYEATSRFLEEHRDVVRYLAQLAVDETPSVKPTEEKFKTVVGLLSNIFITGDDYWGQTIDNIIRERVLEKVILRHVDGVEDLAKEYRALPAPQELLSNYGL